MELGPLQRKWIDALKSGKYQQCGKTLCNEGKYCCLGVANEVCELEEEDKNSLLNSYDLLGLYGSLGDLEEYGMIVDGSKYYALGEANDAGASFKEIAEFIEKNPGNVFQRSV